MDSFKSQPQDIACNADVIYSKLANPAAVRQHIEENMDKLPPEVQQQISSVRFEDDALSVASPMGEVRLAIDHGQCVPEQKIVYTATLAPVPICLVVNLSQQDEGHTQGIAELQLELPFFLRAMVKPQLEKAADQLGQVLTRLPYDKL